MQKVSFKASHARGHAFARAPGLGGSGAAVVDRLRSNGSAGKPVAASRRATTGQSANRNRTRVTDASAGSTTREPVARTDAAGLHPSAEHSSKPRSGRQKTARIAAGHRAEALSAKPAPPGAENSTATLPPWRDTLRATGLAQTVALS